ncbi:cellulose-binding protein, partial [Micromonospora aurantiaca]|nr:cellulose-binding protein [Micromonospora aurantiaca]
TPTPTETPTPTPTPTEQPGDTWQAGTAYAAGDRVTYNGATYTCLQAHTAIAGWEPPNTPALWQAA